jgi:hypothetical protein
MPEDTDETVEPIKNDSVVDLVYVDGEFEWWGICAQSVELKWKNHKI